MYKHELQKACTISKVMMTQSWCVHAAVLHAFTAVPACIAPLLTDKPCCLCGAFVQAGMLNNGAVAASPAAPSSAPVVDLLGDDLLGGPTPAAAAPAAAGEVSQLLLVMSCQLVQFHLQCMFGRQLQCVMDLVSKAG
jgi:hypothetical protein